MYKVPTRRLVGCESKVAHQGSLMPNAQEIRYKYVENPSVPQVLVA